MLTSAAASSAFAQIDPPGLKPVSGGTAIVFVGADPKTLNPTIATGAADITVGCMVHDGLVELRSDGTYEPSLAKSWTISDDGLVYTFDLVETTWHDGKPFTSKDVEFFFKEVSKYAPLVATQIGKKIQKVDVINDHKIAVTLTEPYAPFLRMTACYNGGAIIPQHIYAGSNPPSNPAAMTAIGTGPFKYVDWRPGDSIRLAKNPNYFLKGLPYLDGIVIRPIPSGGSRVQALLAGQGDFLGRFYLPTNDINSIRANPTLKVVPTYSPPNLLFGFFNVSQKPFDDKRVRQALFSVVDRNFIAAAVFSGHGKPAQAPFGHLVGWAGDPDINYDKMYPKDIAAANKKLDEAGLPRDASGIRFKTNISFDVAVPEMLGTATAIQAAWKPLGVDVELRSLELSVLSPRVFQAKDYGVSLWMYNTFGDAAIGLARVWGTSSIGRDFGNGSLYSNPAIDALFAKGAALTKNEDRAKVYQEAQKTLADEMSSMTLYETDGYHAASKKLHGAFGYVSNGRWSHAWLEK